jgi:hypothetical protein
MHAFDSGYTNFNVQAYQTRMCPLSYRQAAYLQKQTTCGRWAALFQMSQPLNLHRIGISIVCASVCVFLHMYITAGSLQILRTSVCEYMHVCVYKYIYTYIQVHKGCVDADVANLKLAQDTYYTCMIVYICMVTDVKVERLMCDTRTACLHVSVIQMQSERSISYLGKRS